MLSSFLNFSLRMNLSILPFREFRKDERDTDERPKNQDILEDGAHIESSPADEEKVSDHYSNANEEIYESWFWAESRPASPAGDDSVPDLSERAGYSQIECEFAAFRARPSLFFFFPE
jgi:hypothetical protein